MALPVIPSIQEIKNRIVSDVESKINQTVPSLLLALIKVISGANSGVDYMLYQSIAWVYRQIFTQTADWESLILWGEIAGITPIPEVSAIIVCDVPGPGAQVTQGTLFIGTNSITYRVQYTVPIVLGVAADVEMLALTGGEIGNLADGEVLNISQTDLALDGTATVTSTLQSGDDSEDREIFRERVISRFRRRATGGSPGDYNLWGLEAPNFVWIGPYADENQAGKVNVYGLVDNQPDGIPTSGQLIELKTYLEIDTAAGKAYRRPIGDVLETLPISIAEFDIEVEIQNAGPDLKDAISTAMEDFILALQPYIEGVSNFQRNTLTKTNLASAASTVAEQGGAIIIDVTITEVSTSIVRERYVFWGGQHGKARNITYVDIA